MSDKIMSRPLSKQGQENWDKVFPPMSPLLRDIRATKMKPVKGKLVMKPSDYTLDVLLEK